jgi:hypothetical protein
MIVTIALELDKLFLIAFEIRRPNQTRKIFILSRQKMKHGGYRYSGWGVLLCGDPVRDYVGFLDHG